MRPYRVACALLLAPLAPAWGQQREPLPPEVETVVTRGYWITPDSVAGTYRVVIMTGGFEHRISELWVEWLAEPLDSDRSARVLVSRRIEDVDAGSVLLVDPVLRPEGERWILTVDAVQTHCDPPLTTRWRLALGQPGKVRILGSTVVRAGCT